VLDGMNRTDAARIGGMDREPGGTGSTGSTSSAPTACATFVPGASSHGCPPIKRPNAPPLLMPGLISASMGPFASEALICPGHGRGEALALPNADTEAVQLHLNEISRHIVKRALAVLLLDRAT